MIRNITGGEGIHISGSIYNAPYIDTTRASAGLVRYVGGNLEVYDGSSWLPLASSYPQIELDSVTQSVVRWAMQKMAEEARIKELAAKHPSVADALDALKKAEEQVQIVAALVEVE
jgi:hypothetical protein